MGRKKKYLTEEEKLEAKRIKKSGIYKITNIINGKVYVGSAVDVDYRGKTHFRILKRNKHHSVKLQNSYNKYGKDNFIFEIIEECVVEDLLTKEQYWIDTLDSCINGYNINPKAGNRLGSKFSEESKKKMSLKRIGNTNCVGRTYSKETLEKMSNTKKGKIPWNKGIPRTEEEKRKIGENRKGKGMKKL